MIYNFTYITMRSSEINSIYNIITYLKIKKYKI